VTDDERRANGRAQKRRYKAAHPEKWRAARSAQRMRRYARMTPEEHARLREYCKLYKAAQPPISEEKRIERNARALEYNRRRRRAQGKPTRIQILEAAAVRRAERKAVETVERERKRLEREQKRALCATVEYQRARWRRNRAAWKAAHRDEINRRAREVRKQPGPSQDRYRARVRRYRAAHYEQHRDWMRRQSQLETAAVEFLRSLGLIGRTYSRPGMTPIRRAAALAIVREAGLLPPDILKGTPIDAERDPTPIS
jgi:hypothetical protein